MPPHRTYHIHLQGQVQGVGFRPFVYQLANRFGLCGWVNNTLDGVHIEFNAGPETAASFYQAVQNEAPALAVITEATMEEMAFQSYSDFQIVHSDAAGEASLLLTPDVALCADCRAELHAPSNRRFGYPFITCTLCGPRYSIIQKLPYDRPFTTMQPFPMCPDCAAEYENPLDRRYYSQTNSCADCGISLQWQPGHGIPLTGAPDELIGLAAEAILEGKILAVKGIGGFLLCCDAGNEAAIQTLRRRKHRPSKPFALMYPSLESLREDAQVGPEQEEELLGIAAPIVLVDLLPNGHKKLAVKDIAPGLNQVGVMLPYAPLLELLLLRVGRPIVATSGNPTQHPIVFDNETALRELPSIADALLLHNREIATPQDDSVIRFSPFLQQRIVLRRSRGMAPTFILPGRKAAPGTVLAMGAMLKSAFGLRHQGNYYLSQYLGDLQNFDTERSFQWALRHLLGLLSARPEAVLTDLHPDYYSTRLGDMLAEEWQVSVFRYQHHEAHFSAALGEHPELPADEAVLGLIWDGTGLGSDGQVWGGEVFRFENRQMNRVGHLEYFPFILGDKMPREPRISALAACHHLPQCLDLLEPMFSETEWRVYRQLLQQPARLTTSSMGRLFDGASALLGLSLRSSYEGEAAMFLKNSALEAFRKYGIGENFGIEAAASAGLSAADVLLPLAEGLRLGESREVLAAQFHLRLVRWAERMAAEQKVRYVVCSGGVFQNGLLADLVSDRLGRDYTVLFHRQLSPNDESIALGQLMLHQFFQ